MSRTRRPAPAPLDRVLEHLDTIATAERELDRAAAARRIAFADLRAATFRFQASQDPADEEKMLDALTEHRQTVAEHRFAEAELATIREAHNPIL